MATGPTRAWSMELSLGADTEEEFLQTLQQLHDGFRLRRGVPKGNGAMGGPTSGWSYTIKHDPEMTHEKYHEQLQIHLGKFKAEEEKL